MLQAEAWFTPALKRIGDVSKTNSIAALPLYHIFALTAVPAGDPLGLAPDADPQSARHSASSSRC